MDKKQFTNVFKDFYPQDKAGKFCEQIFKVFDADNSGKIDFIEFILAISASSDGDIRKKLAMCFRLYDTNKNGKIDKKEMEKMLNTIYDLKGESNRKGDNDPKQRVEAVFNKLDKDRSGTLDEHEFIEGCISDPVLMKILYQQI